MDELWGVAGLAVVFASFAGYFIERRRDDHLHGTIRDLQAESLHMRERVALVETKLAEYE